jgi:hypothetical protein
VDGVALACFAEAKIAEDFSPLVPRYHILFLWEQLRTDMKYRVDYIVDRLKLANAPVICGDTTFVRSIQYWRGTLAIDDIVYPIFHICAQLPGAFASLRMLTLRASKLLLSLSSATA